MKKLSLLVFLFLFSFHLFSQSLYKVEHVEKANNSTLIVEGQVVEQVSFWNPAHTMIFTSNKIKVFKAFKGEIIPEYIEVLTHGGTVDNTSISASDLLELSKDDVGVFFCFPNSVNLKSPRTGERLFDVYASSQGFFKYHVEGNKAAEPFQKFTSITDEVYPLLKNLTGRDFVVKDHSFTIPNGINSRNTNGIINSLSPLTVNAGATSDPTNNVLKITGSGFGTPTGSAAVRFTDANAGGTYWTVNATSSEIISWTDNEINVRVPSRAGTGIVIVRDAAGSEASSFDILNVHYSILQSSNGSVVKQSNLMNANGLGGYSIYYSTNMTPEAITTFNRALKTWKEVAGFNLTDGGTTGTSMATGDGNCVVFMDNAANGTALSAGVLAVCYSFNNICTPASSNLFKKTEFDIVIRSSYSSGSTSFAYGPCAPAANTIDLETVILHELGHAVNLGHIIDGMVGSGSTGDPAKLMNATVANGVKRTSPDVSSFEGSLYATRSNPTLSFGSCDSRTAHVQAPITLDTKDECPLTFPSVGTAPGTTVAFDLEHATSNKKGDPAYYGVLCNSTTTAVTNTLYYVIRTSYAGDLSVNVSDYNLVPSEAATCSGASASAVRLSLYQVNSCPDGQNFPAPIACREFNSNGTVTRITGLTANTNYLMYVDGKFNTKANFKLTFNGGVLPLKFEKFTGEIKGTANVLRWIIASYSDVSKLSLERSADGVDFKSINNYTGALNVNREYAYHDLNGFAGNNFYRLAIYNKDGSVQYSDVVLLKRADKIKISSYPNPVVNTINVSVSAAEALGNVEVKLFNGVGQLMLVKATNVTAGLSNIELDVKALAAGTYRMVVTNKDKAIIDSRSIQKL